MTAASAPFSVLACEKGQLSDFLNLVLGVAPETFGFGALERSQGTELSFPPSKLAEALPYLK